MSPTAHIILDDASAERATVFAHPSAVFVANHPGEVATALAAMQRSIATGHYLAGYFSYELGYVLEPRLAALLPPRRELPLLWFGQFDAPPLQLAGDEVRSLWPDERVYATPLAYDWNRAAYRERFLSVQQAIRAGETYEVNLSMRARFKLTGSARAFYGRLRRQSASAYGAFIDDGERQLLSLSPELFFRIDQDGTVTTRPMKGTAPRGPDAATDTALREALHASTKNRAENLMIVDLIRSDLGRVAATGSVEVTDLFHVESFPTVHQMTSTVTATLRPGTGFTDVLRALYPCGSVTGAPKIRTMQLIRNLEGSPRGAYCGAIGMFAPDGRAHLNVAIRTLTIRAGVGELGVGGAVVSDSEADAEYDECQLKARFYERARRPLTLLETLPYVRGTWPRRARHLQRMHDSAQALGIPFDRLQTDTALDKAVPPDHATDQRVRLLLHEHGRIEIELQPLPLPVAHLYFMVSQHRVAADDPLSRHKTDWRAHYARALTEAHTHGAQEAILLNVRNEVSEGTYTNVFIERAGQLFTPALASGALPGCLRAELIDRGRCVEAILTLDDLATADRVFLGNSLRGLIPAHAITASGTHTTHRR